jgi:L-cysteine desulfidase
MRELLGESPTSVQALVSGNILKNVKSVVVPNTGGRKGLEPAIAVGIVAGDPTRGLQVIAGVGEDAQPQIEEFLRTVPISVSCADTPCPLDIAITGHSKEHSACVRIANNHTNIVYMEKDGGGYLHSAHSSPPRRIILLTSAA